MDLLRKLIRTATFLTINFVVTVLVGSMFTYLLFAAIPYLLSREFWDGVWNFVTVLPYLALYSIPGLLLLMVFGWLFGDRDSFPPRGAAPRRGRRMETVDDARRRARERLAGRQARRSSDTSGGGRPRG